MSTKSLFKSPASLTELKKYAIISELLGTLGNAVRGVERIYESFHQGGYMTEEQRGKLLGVVRSISGKVFSVGRHRKFD